MSVTITPTVTPAPKPEWPEITGYLCRDGFGYVSILVGDEGDVKEDIGEQSLLLLATVAIPSSAACERQAKVEAAREELIKAADALVNPLTAGGPESNLGYHLAERMSGLRNALYELRFIQQEAP